MPQIGLFKETSGWEPNEIRLWNHLIDMPEDRITQQAFTWDKTHNYPWTKECNDIRKLIFNKYFETSCDGITGGWWHLNWGGRLVVMAGAESVVWYQIHGFHVFDAIPVAPFQTFI